MASESCPKAQRGFSCITVFCTEQFSKARTLSPLNLSFLFAFSVELKVFLHYVVIYFCIVFWGFSLFFFNEKIEP